MLSCDCHRHPANCELDMLYSSQITHVSHARGSSLSAACFRVTRKLLKEAQHQVVLLANENRQLNGVRERAVMPAWSSATLGANLVEFKTTQVSLISATISA